MWPIPPSGPPAPPECEPDPLWAPAVRTSSVTTRSPSCRSPSATSTQVPSLSPVVIVTGETLRPSSTQTRVWRPGAPSSAAESAGGCPGGAKRSASIGTRTTLGRHAVYIRCHPRLQQQLGIFHAHHHVVRHHVLNRDRRLANLSDRSFEVAV